MNRIIRFFFYNIIILLLYIIGILINKSFILRLIVWLTKVILNNYFQKPLPFSLRGKIFCIGTSISPSFLYSYLTTHDPFIFKLLCVMSKTIALAQILLLLDLAKTKLPIFKLLKFGSLLYIMKKYLFLFFI